jgi:hypothetical protein
MVLTQKGNCLLLVCVNREVNPKQTGPGDVDCPYICLPNPESIPTSG